MLGNQTITKVVGLSEFPVYVRQGTILPLQRAAVQYSDQIGGQLQVQVYGGRDGKFEMVEDDGMTLEYKISGDTAVRTTDWVWSDASKTLSYSVTGSYSGQNTYTTVEVCATRVMPHTYCRHYRELTAAES